MYLSKKIMELEKLKIHCFGHIHESRGVKEVGKIKYINASICGMPYSDLGLPVDLEYKGSDER